MKLTREQVVRGGFHVVVLALIGYLVLGFIPSSPATVAVDDQTYRITGPYTHENLSIYLIHSDTQDERTFITLDEGLKSGVVTVAEKKNAQVNELVIENTGNDHLFLQEGDRVKGGQQDRTIYTSLVVPPHSGQIPLPAFCVEPHRWAVGAKGAQFGGTANPAVCPKEVRLVAKVQKDQGKVWAAVAQQNDVCRANGLARINSSSLNESLDAPKVKRIADEFAQALNGVIEGHDDVVGVAIAINGKVEEVNFYPNYRLLGKQYPRLVQSYSLAATLKQKDAAKATTLSAMDVGRFVWSSEQEAKRAEVAKVRTTSPRSQSDVLINVQQTRTGSLMFGVGVNSNSGLTGEIVLNERNVQQTRTGSLMFGVGVNSNSGLTGEIVLNERNFVNQVENYSARNLRRSEAVNNDNRMEIVEQAAVVNCKTEYNGKLVHRQYLTRNRPSARGDSARQMQQEAINPQEREQRLLNQPSNDNLVQPPARNP